MGTENVMSKEKSNKGLTDVGRVVSFNTYGKNNRVIQGTIVESRFDNELGLKYFAIKPSEHFNGYQAITRTEKEIF